MAESKPKDIAAGAGELLTDAVGPAAREFGKELAPVGKEAGEVGVRAARVLLRPLRGVVWGLEQVEDWIVDSIGPKIARIPEEERVDPPLVIAGPLLDAMKYCGAEQHLREIFASLLATSMDARTVSTAHPAFVEMAKQLSPDEARMLKKWSSSMSLGHDPTVTLYRVWEGRTGNNDSKLEPRFHKVFGPYSRIAYRAGCTNLRLVPSYIINLRRLEIVTHEVVNTVDPLVAEDFGDDDIIRAVIKEIMSVPKMDGVHRQPGYLSATPLGTLFIDACISPPNF